MIMYLKSSLSISSYSGCVINCKYCILSTYRDNNSINKECDENELCEKLFKSKFFVKDLTPISINNISDPFLNNILKKSTFKILDYLEDSKIQNPLILITKGYLSEQDLEKLSNYKCNIHIFYTYSGLSETMENRNKERQIDTIKHLSELKNIKLVHYWRPVIEGVNSSDEVIDELIFEVGKYFNISVISGIRLNTHLSDIFRANNIPINIKTDTEHKIIHNDTFDRIKNKILLSNSSASVFKKTSCAISYCNSLQDINGYSYDVKVCSKDCPNLENCTMGKEKPITTEHFNNLLSNISKKCAFEIFDDHIIVNCTLTQEESSYLKHNTRRKIQADLIIKSNSEEVLSQ